MFDLLNGLSGTGLFVGLEIALIAVDVEGAEYWDSPSSTVLHAYGYVKAIATGTPPSGGENAKVSFT